MTVELEPIPEATQEPMPVEIADSEPKEAVQPAETKEPAKPEPIVEEQPAKEQKPTTLKKRGRPAGSKNKAPRKKEVTIVEQVDTQHQEKKVQEKAPEKEEAYIAQPPPSPRSQKQMYLQEINQAKAELDALRVKRFSSLLDQVHYY